MTTRHKLIVSPQDIPWLFDLETDQDDLVNAVQMPQYRDTLRILANELLAYGKQYNDHYVTDAKMNADLKWAASGDGAPPAVPVRRVKAAGNPAKKNANKRNNQKTAK